MAKVEKKVHFRGWCKSANIIIEADEGARRIRDVTCGACRQRIAKQLLDNWDEMTADEELALTKRVRGMFY
jgi:hypothetical protein